MGFAVIFGDSGIGFQGAGGSPPLPAHLGNLPGKPLASTNALPLSLEKTAYLKAKGTLGFIEFVPNSSTFNHPETVSLQAAISFTNEGMQ